MPSLRAIVFDLRGVEFDGWAAASGVDARPHVPVRGTSPDHVHRRPRAPVRQPQRLSQDEEWVRPIEADDRRGVGAGLTARANPPARDATIDA